MSYNGASTDAHVVFAFWTIVSVVSFALSLVVVVAIGLPLVREPEKRTPAASFNLYIVLFSLTDMLWMAWGVGWSVVFYCVQWEGTETLADINNAIAFQHFPQWIFFIAYFFCFPVLLWTVPLVSREILELLRNSKQRKRCKPPTLQRVALHGMVSCAAGITAYVLRLFFTVPGKEWLVLCAVALVPFAWTLWIVFRVFREGLIQFGAGVGNRLRVLVVYFARIVLVYSVMAGCMVIALVLATGGVAWMPEGVVRCAIAYLFGIQGWVNFAVIRTKPDVGKMIRDLFAGTACRGGGSNQTGSNDQTTSAEPIGRQTESTTTTQEDVGTAIRDDAAEGREGNENNRGAGLSVHELVSREFIEGIEDYLSDDEDDDGVVGDGNADAGVVAEAGAAAGVGRIAVVATADTQDVGANAGAGEEAI